MGILQDEADAIRQRKAGETALARANRPLLWQARWDAVKEHVVEGIYTVEDWTSEHANGLAFLIVILVVVGLGWLLMTFRDADEAYPSAYGLTTGYLTSHPHVAPLIREHLEDGVLTLSEWDDIQDAVDEIDAAVDRREHLEYLERQRESIKKALEEAHLVIERTLRD